MLRTTAAPTDSEIAEIVSHLKNGAQVALTTATKPPNMLSGTFTGSKLTGVNLCIGAGMRDTLDMALSTLPGCGPHRAPGTILQIAQTSKTIDNALRRSEEHTSELQSLMRISYAVFCLKKKHKHI